MLSHWVGLLAGCVVTVFLMLRERYKKPVSLRVYTAVVLALLFFSCYQAWLDDHTGRVGREADMHRLEGEKVVLSQQVVALTAKLEAPPARVPGRQPAERITDAQVLTLTKSLRSESGQTVLIVYPSMGSGARDMLERWDCLRKLTAAFVRAGWTIIPKNAGRMGEDHVGFVLPRLIHPNGTIVLNPNYDVIETAFREAKIPYSSFDGIPSSVDLQEEHLREPGGGKIPIIYIGQK